MNIMEQAFCSTTTENGALAYSTTGNCCLDFFSLSGALRDESEIKIIKLFEAAFKENPDYAMKALFYARDVRGGLGERNLFRVILKYLALYYPASVLRNLEYIAEYGRFDDCLVLLHTPCEQALIQMISKQLEDDINACEQNKSVSLLAKWLPSVNASNRNTKANAVHICKLLHMSEKKYRKTLSKLRSYIDVVEKYICQKDYSFDYSKIPSGALFKYRKAFIQNDKEDYDKFLEQVKLGRIKMKTNSITHYDIVNRCIDWNWSRDSFDEGISDDIKTLDITWRALPNYVKDENAIAVIDGSGSMYYDGGKIVPISAAIALGIYFAEHCEGCFHNQFITFSENPQLVRISGENIYEKVIHCMQYNQAENTNIQKVFELILNTAVKNNLPQNELPQKIYVISDMEFDIQSEADNTIFQIMKRKYREAGYELPLIVYWNVMARNQHYPVNMEESGALLVSGDNPVILEMITSIDNPLDYMYFILKQERYEKIAA